jgi:hypothetical protein
LLQGMQHTPTPEAMIFIWALQVLSGLGHPKYMESNPMYEFASLDICCNAHFVRTERCIVRASTEAFYQRALKLLLQKQSQTSLQLQKMQSNSNLLSTFFHRDQLKHKHQHAWHLQ